MKPGLPVFNYHAAGIDIADTVHYVAIADKNGGYTIKITSAYTCDLREIVSFLKENGITTAAMESTGVYWLALYILLEEAGIETYLVNAKHVKNVNGRKKDDIDAVWIQKLHTCGLLQKSFQPDNETRVLRNYTRHRKRLIELASDSIRRMQKALEQMNIKIHTVISDLTGKTGISMMKAILNGERDPNVLHGLCDVRILASKEEIIKSLEGIWADEQIFILGQAFENYEFHQKQIKACEEKIQAQLLKQTAKIKEGDVTIKIEPALKHAKKRRKRSFNTPIFQYLKAMAGVDLTRIPGISEVTALDFIGEVGVDTNKWKGSNYFAAWLNLTPNSKITGGKIISSKLMKRKNTAGQCLRQAASTLRSNKTPLGDYYRRMRMRLGKKGAVVATAHKMAKIIYTMMATKTEYNPDLLILNHKKDKEFRIKKLEKQLERLKRTG